MSSFGNLEVSGMGVIDQLNELFGSALHLDIIKSVASSCDFDLVESSNKLLELTGVSDKRKYEDTDMDEEMFISKVNSKSGESSIRLSKTVSFTTLPKKSRKTLDFEVAVNQINKGYKVLILMRGLPGSGKSTLAKKILEHTIGFDMNYHLHILSTDDYFCQNSQNVYQYDVRKLDEAHNWNQKRAFQAMSRGFSPVIIDNTNVQMWEMKSYATMAIDYGYLLYIIEPDTHWCFNDKELFKRNTHGIYRGKIKDMLDRYEKNITPEKLLSAYNIVYKHQKTPQLRLYPPPDFNVSKDNIGNKSGTFVKSTSMSVLSNKTENIQNIENVNLMYFDDVEGCLSTKSQPVDKNFNSVVLNNYCSQNAVDKILMFNDNNQSTTVLKPTATAASVATEKDIFIISDDEDEVPMENDLYSRVEHAWGIKESSLKSWDIVSPITEPFKGKQNLPETTFEETKNIVETNDNSTMTDNEYFRLLSNDKLSSGFFGGLVVLDTVNRDINHSTPKREPNISFKLTLDKGCMTDDFFEDFENHISELESLFPSVPKNHLTYWYNKCKGDLEWTIEFLLEAKDEIMTLIVTDDSDNDKAESSDSNAQTVGSNDSNKVHKITKKRVKKSGNSSSPDDKEEIKKLIESKIDIGGEHYSKHLLKVKNYKSKNDYTNSNASESQITINEPSTESQVIINGPSTSKCIYQDNSDEVISIDSDMDFDEIEIEKEAEETVELNLGEHFVTELEKKFADPNIQYPKGFQPVVQMPVALAKQLYSFYIESIFQQMENQEHVMESLLKEDEEFARKLQASEQEEISSTEPNQILSLKEIQEDQQAAKRLHQREVDKWKDLNPDTLAAKLTKQKLFSIFPTIDQDTLLEILHAHDDKYVDTVETLLLSTKSKIIQGSEELMKEPPIRDEVLEEMKEAQKSSSCNETADPQEATYYREEANRYLKRREDLYQKAQKYHQKGMAEVAQFYSGLASLQTTYFDRSNSLAATAFLDEHSKRLQDFNTLDLHFLYVKEALPSLDVFLDRNINLLRHSSIKQSEYLQIITGRGNRSKEGISKIKPAVISRLHKRNIKYVVLNPGLLKVKITKNSLVTSEFSTS
ncbi:unnamed protein product [Psylliodes chrysocephalus]|uniref:NEDD4-binding protein 2 n=1 Tax=Psylliodes chrysocephalus TaxID=3402493 RepID=A0A9P0CM70_9CUCU|nr:unnamed protein product [Psylliodes chrysocephala]